MTEQVEVELEYQEIQLPDKTEEIIAATKDIIDYRVSTAILPNDEKYIENQESYKEYIDSFVNDDMNPFIPMGLLSEGIFFLACKKAIPSYIKISNAEQDQKGVDFILSTKSREFFLNLTINPHKYYRRLEKPKTSPILLPNNQEFFMKMFIGESYTYEDYLYEVFALNQKVLRNENDLYRIIVKNGKKKWYVRSISGRKEYKGFPKKKDRKLIVISSGREEDIYTIISILNNIQ